MTKINLGDINGDGKRDFLEVKTFSKMDGNGDVVGAETNLILSGHDSEEKIPCFVRDEYIKCEYSGKNSFSVADKTFSVGQVTRFKDENNKPVNSMIKGFAITLTIPDETGGQYGINVKAVFENGLKKSLKEL